MRSPKLTVLTGLAITNIHRNIKVDIDRVINRYGGSGNREIDFFL